jgi:hypothetical protein
VTAIRNGIFINELAAQLSAAVTEFHCLGIVSFAESQSIQDGQSWVTELNVVGVFAATDL